ncbi:MAG: GldG family protein [Bryobacterales bacterium]|nr:GldG family protein [Bryobacterales bacterium]
MKTRQTKFTAFTVVYIAVVIAVLGVANWLSTLNSTSLDVTSNKRFSLADQTEKVVKGLKTEAKIYYFDKTADFPRAKDLLDRYDALSGKLNVEYVDVVKKPQVAKQYGIRNLGAVFVEVNGKREEARSLSEEEVTSALIRALKTGERRVCSVIGSGEHGFDDNSPQGGYSRLKELIERNNYKTQSIRLLEKPEVPKECTIVIVGGPRFDYAPPAVGALAKFYAEGGRVLVALDPPMQLGKETIAENELLIKLLGEWGFAVEKNLVLDTSGVGQLFGLSEVVPLVTSYEGHVIVRDMREVATAFPLARSIDVKTGVPNVTTEKLFSSSPNSFATTNLKSAEIKIDSKNDKKGPLLLAGVSVYNPMKEGKAMGRAILVGSSSFMANNILGFNGNRDLAMNMLNWLAADEDLISIRPKDPQDRRLSLTRRQMSFVFYASVFLIPLLVIGAGISVWWKRR